MESEEVLLQAGAMNIVKLGQYGEGRDRSKKGSEGPPPSPCSGRDRAWPALVLGAAGWRVQVHDRQCVGRGEKGADELLGGLG